ncbi:MAG: LA2681 family HEPN domain-containing protein [Candidatus Berkelbacteria bacterium]|nr:LA2681 family HEPN domain-containing protein [Candidatus Berkelbacteria bacterium]
MEQNLHGLSNDKALNYLAQLIDSAHDQQSSEKTTLAFGEIAKLEDRELAPAEMALLYYFRSNAWANRIQEQGDQHSWNWEQTALQNQLLELRRALSHEGFYQLDPIRRCQIHTNLGNQLNSIGRFIEAIASWDSALAILPNFAMAHINRALGFESYSRCVYDPGHQAILALSAYDAYECALQPEALFESEENKRLKPKFIKYQEVIAQLIDVERVRQLLADQEQPLTGTRKEKQYKRWTLKNRLYVNPVNDACDLPIASQDVMTLPSIMEPFESSSYMPPPIVGFYNQLKQEYVSARFLLYQALHSDATHYSDTNVLLYNTLDYPSYGLSVEKLRAAFRMAYSLFDKIAFGLNRYLVLGHEVHRVSFRSLWYMPKKKTIHSKLENRENWPLRGLYWLSKDLHDPEFQLSTEPEAAELATIRNHLEHKYLQIHEEFTNSMSGRQIRDTDWGHHFIRSDFEAKTLRLLQLGRAALIYFCAAIHREEQMNQGGQEGKLTVPMSLDQWEDEWKF